MREQDKKCVRNTDRMRREQIGYDQLKHDRIAKPSKMDKTKPLVCVYFFSVPLYASTSCITCMVCVYVYR